VLPLTSIEIIFILLFLSVLLISSSLFHKAFAESPAFDQIFITDTQLGGHDWVQTYGNDSTHLKSDYTNILAVDYVSNGKNLNATLWLKSASENASTYSQPFKKIRYGMLIAIASLPPTSGYNGANYDFYIEAVNGKWSEYLYLLSSTGTRALISSKVNYTEPFGGTMIGPGYVKLRFDLDSIDFPKAYGLSFYTAESFKSNEVRDFTNWVDIPPDDLHTLTDPKDTAIRQGEVHIIPVEMNSPFSSNVTSIKFEKGTNYSSNGISVSAERIQPPLFKVDVSPQTPAGVYTIPFVASMSINTTLASPTSAPATATVERVTKVVDPEFQISKKFPTIGYITGPANLTIHVSPALTFNETFSTFWGSYGDLVALLSAGIVGSVSTYLIENIKSRRENKSKKKDKIG
jgi:hypothetical protein